MYAENFEESHCSSLESRLYQSVISNDEKAVESLLNQGIDFSIKVEGPLSSIHIAVFKGHVNIVEQLLRHGADPNARYPVAENSYTGSTLLYQAAARGSEAVVSLLLQYNADVKAKNVDGSTPLHIATERGCLTIVSMLLQKGAKVNFENEDDPWLDENFYQEQFLESKILRNELNFDDFDVSNISIFDGMYSPLHLAIKAEHNNIMKLLVESGADIDATDNHGDTALSLAVQTGCVETVEYLLKHSPSLEKLGNKKALSYAVKIQSENFKLIVQILLQYGFIFDSELEEADEFLPGTAIENGYSEVIFKLFGENEDFGDNPKENRRNYASQILTKAITEENEDVVNFLLEQGASIDKKFNLSSIYSLEKCNLNFLQLLITNGLNVQNDPKLLFFAIKENKYEVIHFLLKNKVDVNKCVQDQWFLSSCSYSKRFRLKFPKSNYKVSPLLVAAAIGDEQVVKLFMEYGADINFKTDNCLTPLLMAVAGGHIEVVEMFLNSEANIESTDSDGRTPIFLAAECGHDKVVGLLLRYGAKFDIKPGNSFWGGETVYHVSAEKGHLNVIRTLLEYDTHNLVNSEESSQQKTPLHYAAKNGHTSIVKLLLDHGAQINQKDEEGETALFDAASNGHAETVRVLLEYGASVRTVSNFQKNNPLRSAACGNNDEVVKLLLKFGAKPDMTPVCDWGSPLTTSAEKGNMKILEMLIKSGANINYITPNGETALSLALKNGHTEIAKLLHANGANFSCDKQRSESLLSCTERGRIKCIEFLLNISADVNSTDSSGQTALHLAIVCNRLDIVQLLVKFGANINAVDKKLRAALALSAEKGNSEIVEILLKNGANIEAADYLGRTALYISAENGHEDVLNLLLVYNANTNHRAQNCKSPIIISAERGQFKIVATLVRKGVNINFSDNNGRTALYFAAECGHVATVKLLLEHKAKVDASTKNGETPLMIASKRGRLNCIDPLLKSRANVHATDSQDRRPIHYAGEFGHQGIVELLLKQCADIKCELRNDVSFLLNCAAERFLKVVNTLMEFGAEFDLNAKPDLVDSLAISLPKWSVDVFTRVIEYYGADVKFLREANFRLLFDAVNKAHTNQLPQLVASEESDLESIAKALVCYRIKMKAASLLSNDENLVATAYCDETLISSFENECIAEVSSMKCETVGDSDIFVYNILKEGLNRLASFARNNNIAEVLASDNFGSKFPLYRDIIRNQFDKGKIRRRLIDQCVEICLSHYYHFKPLPSNIIESILLYLNNRDLRSLLVSNHHSCTSD